jgi:hypothetical protein
MKSVFSCLADEKMAPKAASLTFQFREKIVPVTFHASIAPEVAKMATTCEPFQTWVKNCEQPSTDGRMIDIRSVEIQSVDLFGKRYVICIASLWVLLISYQSRVRLNS